MAQTTPRTPRIGELSSLSCSPARVPLSIEFNSTRQCSSHRADQCSRSLVKKCWVVIAVMLMTSSVYMGSSIWSPAVKEGAEYFGVGEVTSTLGISLFVLGYGVGPLFLAPMTEVPAIGRTVPYIITLGLFCILQVPTALATNFAGFCVLRFLAGFIGSPPLATVGKRTVPQMRLEGQG